MNEIPHVLVRIQRLEFKEIGFGGECLSFAIALRKVLNEGDFYGIWDEFEKYPYHILLLWNGYFIDSNTIKNEKDYITEIVKKYRRTIRKIKEEHGIPLGYTINEEEVDKIYEALSKTSFKCI